MLPELPEFGFVFHFRPWCRVLVSGFLLPMLFRLPKFGFVFHFWGRVLGAGYLMLVTGRWIWGLLAVSGAYYTRFGWDSQGALPRRRGIERTGIKASRHQGIKAARQQGT